MTFDPSQPTDNSKIRDLSTLITPNWEAIEGADLSFKPIGINFNNRNPLPPNDDPAPIENAYILYCKEDSGANPELFGRDEDGNITQFSSKDFTFAQDGHALIPPGFLMNWGRANIPTGNSRKVAVVFTREFGAVPWVIHVTPYVNPMIGGGSNAREIGADNFSTTGFDARIFNGDALQVTPVGWIAIGEIA